MPRSRCKVRCWIWIQEFDAQRQAVRRYLAATPAVWEFRVQLAPTWKRCRWKNRTVAWPEDDSPYVTVARIEAQPQEAYSDAMVAAIDKGASFSPWHGLAAHQPLGAINRLRKAIYEASAGFRLDAMAARSTAGRPRKHPVWPRVNTVNELEMGPARMLAP